MKKKDKAFSNTKIAVVFFVFLAFIIGISLLYKFTILLKSGQFTDSRSFTLSVANGKATSILSLSPGLGNIAVFEFPENVGKKEAGRFLGIPIDGYILSDSLDLNQKPKSLFFKAIINYDNLKTNFTIIDLLRIAMFTRAVPERSVNVVEIKNTDKPISDSIVSRFASDNFIEKDNKTVKIINATGISGLGNRLARLLANVGADVLLVATDNNLSRRSTILYIGEKSYTVERLQKVLGYEAIRGSGDSMSDITIVIGKDKVDSAPF